ncbi:hypothetical protein [Pseudomonas fluorescens]|nr:hypothetical protein [Pseudomonas fluorescens]
MGIGHGQTSLLLEGSRGFAQPKALPTRVGADRSALKSDGTKAWRQTFRYVSRQAGSAGSGGAARGNGWFMTCTPLIVFGGGWAALVITVVVQHRQIKPGVRTFFLMTRGLVKPVQEKKLRATFHNQPDMQLNMLKLNINTFCYGFRFFGQANRHSGAEKIAGAQVVV